MSWKSAAAFLSILARRDEDEGALGRHSALLASLIILLVALPLVQMATGSQTGFPLLLTLVLCAAVIVNSHQRTIYVIATLAAGLSIAGISYAEFANSDSIRSASQIIGLGLLSFTTLLMFNSLVQAENVSEDTIVGGICVYLLMGLCFAVLYILMIDLTPGAFLSGEEILRFDPGNPNLHATAMLYFSFVTMTTLGYGDIAPGSDLAQMCAVVQALVGQLYLTIFLARLVALYVSRDRRVGR
ncbi:MAG: potassium channel family protein [Myxococcota bacterium]